jgi:PAS domain S-box-containing protein
MQILSFLILTMPFYNECTCCIMKPEKSSRLSQKKSVNFLKKLQKNECGFQSIIENSSDAVVVVDRKTTILYANPSSKHLLGYAPSECIGMTGFSFMHKSDIWRIRKELLRLLQKQNSSVVVECRMKHKDGRWVWVQATGTNLLKNENLGAIVVNLRNISAQKEAEEVLKKSEERYKAFVEQSSEGIWRFEIDTPIDTTLSISRQLALMYKYAYLAECNDATARMYGYKSSKQITGARLTDFMDPTDEQNIAYLTAFIKSGYRLLNTESHEVDKKGNKKYFLNNLIGVVENGKVLRAWGTQRDVTEQQQTETALKQSELLFRQIIESANEGIFGMDKQARCMFINEAAIKLLGYTREECIGKNLHTLTHSKKLDGSKYPFNQCPMYEPFKTRQKVQHIQEVLWKKDGSPLNVLLSFSPIDGEENNISGVVTLVDNTERKMYEQALQASEAHFRSLADFAPVMIWTARADGLSSWFNKPWLTFTGRSLEEEIGDHDGWMDGLHPDDKNRFVDIYTTSFNARIEFEIEYRLRRHDGQYRWIMDHGMPRYDENGNFIGYVGSCIDIHDRRRVENEILRTQALTYAILSSLTAHIAVIDHDGKIIAVNNAWNTFALENGDTSVLARTGAGENYLTVLQNSNPELLDEASKVYRGIRSVLDGKVSEYNLEYTCDSPSNERWFLLQVTPLNHSEGGAVVSHMNITERKRLERQKDDFIGVASHELKTPVTSVKAYTQVMQRRFQKAGDLESAQLLGKMDGQLTKLTNLIRDLLDVTKIETGKLQFTEEDFWFDELIMEMVEELQRTTERHTIEVKGRARKKVYADRERIGQVLTNFLSNAIKYSPHAKKVVVTTRIVENEIQLCVQDFGVGIASDKHDKVFERFFRVDGPKQDTFPGLGLGLYISSEIIRRQGGRIWVESKKGKGSSFYFALPIVTKRLRKPVQNQKKISSPHPL